VLSRFLPRVTLRDNRADFAILDVGHQVLEHDIVMKGAAKKAEVLQIEGRQVQLYNRGGDGVATTTIIPAGESVRQPYARAGL
jgi:hypothetical protein